MVPVLSLCLLWIFWQLQTEVNIQDVTMAMVPPSGVDIHLSHWEYPSNVFGFAIDLSQPEVNQLEDCLTGYHLVLIPASIPRVRFDLITSESTLASPGRSSKPVGISVPWQWWK